MILVLLVLPILAVSANPFHKYPYVFLLDVGNEELEEVNTEQIRLSSPGGSLALRYPAIGNGDDIAHVRVSGIDFGTDLKANIVDGGPGYKYVVIVLMGKPMAYDAIITIQTVASVVSEDSIQTVEDNSSSISNEDGPSAYQVSEEDQNNSSEDLNDSSNSEEAIEVGINEKNAELTQESSNVYSYANNERLSSYGSEYNNDGGRENSDDDDDDSDGNDSEQADGYKSYNDNSNQGDNIEVEDYGTNEEGSRANQPSSEKNTLNDDYSQSGNQPVVVDQNLYNKYEALKDYLYNGVAVYSQGSIQENSAPANSANQNYDVRPNDIEEVYDDYEENDSEMYRDDNNNFIDTNDASAIAY